MLRLHKNYIVIVWGVSVLRVWVSVTGINVILSKH